MNSSTTAGTTFSKSCSVILFARSTAIFNAILSTSVTTGSKAFLAACKLASASSTSAWVASFLSTIAFASATAFVN